MNGPDADQVVVTRRVACARCGTEFACDLSGQCWCAAEEVRLPMPALDGSDGDCLCRACLRAVAAPAQP